MRVDLFDFDLPEGCIAKTPASPRDSARLLRVTPDALADMGVRDIPALLKPGDVMVFNDTRVIPARLHGRRGEIAVECLLHQAVDAQSWLCFARPAKRLKPGQTIVFAPDFAARVGERTPDGQVLLTFDCPDLFAMLERYGEMPLPPYMHRRAGASDRTDYQTAYARHPGSVAAPTAGLHFTPKLLAAIDAAGARRVHVTLHVGAGTFLPVKADDTDDHVMHAEWAHVSEEAAAAINAARQAGGRVVAVGTTSLRTLESMADENGVLQAGRRETRLFITPGYRFRCVDVLMTNFHLPRSTLLMLVSAFAGRERMLAAYRHAIADGYRFYSYGDACWLEPAA
ncbi:MAG: tRNA preQ1(34) S-adenosylmethionine ribosyltransferase-isomerase QueA [Rhodospirillales bacterium]|nr:tRNA preQ1(34) S-adenosylmethionine ribosyltransferase-isomerase QueA [Alphaproteobacteria bacterium]MCB9986417.1 tRNA preQ1(34) S-adenosylmethionine ribosyltransferase-isomerase QueA [Rhodospirillales bacterium]USO07037.1 MAG: tRNA preQ1(34) S-adenosylmethionine ribosyltransferase-isomerase QueA [Rhodospirillales bacterium]